LERKGVATLRGKALRSIIKRNLRTHIKAILNNYSQEGGKRESAHLKSKVQQQLMELERNIAVKNICGRLMVDRFPDELDFNQLYRKDLEYILRYGFDSFSKQQLKELNREYVSEINDIYEKELL
jgi:hypothetical protein